MNQKNITAENIIELLKIESSKAVGMDPGITTVTFFTTDDITKATTHLKERFYQILVANPWLAGRLVRPKKSSRLQLHLPDNINQATCDALFKPKVKIAINTNMPFPELCKTVSKNKAVAIGTGFSLINKNKPLVCVSIAPIKDNQYALIYSLSHVIADGATFYRIQNMLCTEDKIIALNAQRHQDYSMEAAVGKQDSAFVFYKSFMLNIIKNLVFGKKPKYLAYYINETAIEKTKAEVASQGTVPYVSTNDIIMSAFMRAIKARIAMLVMNFRNRFKGVTSNDAGNYEGVKLYDEDAYKTPEAVRKTLLDEEHHHTLTHQLPGAWQRVTMRIAQLNNWASFSGNFALPDCKPILHLPIVPPIIPLDIAVLFRPLPNRIALLILAKHHNRGFYKNNKANPLCQYLAEPVSKPVFPDS